MSAVGIFAGRGDILVAMGLAILVGFWFGWRARGLADGIRRRRAG